MRITALKDGSCIGVEVLAIDAVPLSENLDDDTEQAIQKNIAVFSEILNAVFHDSSQQDTVVELLCSTVPVTGQVYAARLQFFVILRKFSRRRDTLAARMKNLRDSCTAAMESASYLLKNERDSWTELERSLGNIQESAVLSIEKQLRIRATPSQNGYVCYTDTYHLTAPDNYSRVYEALAKAPGTALAFQLIPTSFTRDETSFIQGVSLYFETSALTSPQSQPNDAMTYYNNMLESLGRQHYLHNILIIGPQDTANIVGNRLKTALQQEDGTVGLELVNRSGALLPYRDSYPMYPWNMITCKAGNPARPDITPSPFRRLLHVISLSEALTFFHSPIDEGTIVGVLTNRTRVSRDIFKNVAVDGKSILLGTLSGTGNRLIPFAASLKEFTRHALVVGMPGTGKTTFSVHLLLQFYKEGIPFLAIEPTKSEYRAMIDAVPSLQVFTPGKNTVVPFIINPFLPPAGISLETFKPSLLSAFKAAFSMPSPLDILFANALDACYVKYGWRGYSKSGDRDVKAFGLQEFVCTFREIIRSSGYSAETKGNMESAGVFRLLNLIIQNGNIYDTEKSVPLEDLLRRPTVIELNAIDNQEQKALIMALLLINIVLYTKHNQKGDGQLKNILLIDEAHVLLGGNTATGQDGAAEASASTVKALQNMIVEIRSYGTGIIIADQSPQKVTKEIVGNTDIKVMFQLVQREDKDIIAASSNMSERDEDQLSRLNTGEAFAYYRGLVEPVRINTEDIREKESIRLVVPDEEIRQRSHYWDDKQEMLKPYSQCSVCAVCNRCEFALRDDAKFFVDQFMAKDKPQLREKKALFSLLLTMDARLQPLAGDYQGERYRRLLYCVCIRYIRKAALETSASLSETETVRVLEKVMELNQEH